MKDDIDRYDKTIYVLDLNNLKEKPTEILINGVDYVCGFEWIDKKTGKVIEIRQPWDFEKDLIENKS